MDDDGFESLNGNGSSDNGEEVPVDLRAVKNEDASDEASGNNNTETEGEAEAPSEIPPEVRCNAWVQEIVQKRGILLNRRQSAPALQFSAGELESDSDTDTHATVTNSTPLVSFFIFYFNFFNQNCKIKYTSFHDFFFQTLHH